MFHFLCLLIHSFVHSFIHHLLSYLFFIQSVSFPEFNRLKAENEILLKELDAVRKSNTLYQVTIQQQLYAISEKEELEHVIEELKNTILKEYIFDFSPSSFPCLIINLKYNNRYVFIYAFFFNT